MMKRSIADRLSDGIRFFLLRGSGWQRRNRRTGAHDLTEWRDPISGHWYSTGKALEIFQHQMLMAYPSGKTMRRPYSLRC